MKLLEGLRGRVGALREGEDHLGVDAHLRVGALDSVLGEQLLVVEDDPVVDSDHGAVADRVVVRGDRRVALRVVAHVDEHLRGALRDDDLVEERARSRALLVDVDAFGVAAVGVADRIGAALGDPGEERLGSERPVGRAGGGEAISSYSAHTILRRRSEPAVSVDHVIVLLVGIA